MIVFRGRILTELVLLSHGINEITRAETLVKGTCELLSGTVESTTKTGTNGEQTSNQGGDEILAGTGGDDCVHSTRHGRTVISSKHEHHFQKLAGVVWKSAAEPQE
jgi:hypothetical protein